MEGDPGKPVYTLIIAISIHSLRMEGDKSHCTSKIIPGYFNPLPPHGGRQNRIHINVLHESFQSTPSAWRETALRHHIGKLYGISIHSLRMEGDHHGIHAMHGTCNFNPLPPHGGRLTYLFFHNQGWDFNPLPPHGGRQTGKFPSKWP